MLNPSDLTTFEFFNNFEYSEVSNKHGVLIRHGNFLYLLHKKTVFEAGFSEINKRGSSNKACSWEKVFKKNKKNSMLIRDFCRIRA